MHAPAIAAAFGLGPRARLSPGPVARGKQGAVWRLETIEGTWAVKVPLGSVTEESVAPGVALQDAAHAAGVPTPAVRRTRDGQVLLPLEDRVVQVHEWVDVASPDPHLDPRLVGATLARIHSVVIPVTGPLEDWYAAAVGRARWDDLVRRLRSAQAPFAEELAALRDDLVEVESWLELPSSLQLCHRDLWADNVLPTPDGGVCVLDWDNTGPADPVQELACVLFEFARGDPGRARDLVAAYDDAGGTARVEQPGDFSMLVAQLGHITEMAASDWLDPNPRSPERSDAEAWVRETLDDPHTPRVLRSLLAASRSVPVRRRDR